MTTKTKLFIGAVVFAGSSILSVPQLHHPAWAHALLNFAALVLVPLLLDLVGDANDGVRTAKLLRSAARLQLPAALLLVLSCLRAPGLLSALCALPWATVLLLLAATGGGRIVGGGWRGISPLCRDVGLVYAAVGAAWLIADRWGLRPLNFEQSIVLLTAVHFHYAGLILPVLTGLMLRQFPTSLFALFVGLGVIAGVPAVAVGITTSQLLFGFGIETMAALLMAGSGIGAALLQVRLALQQRWPMGVRCLWIVAGCSLAAGMLLAGLYGLRVFFQPWPWLDIPWMRALHGSLNAIGFSLCGLWGWRGALSREAAVPRKRD